MAAPSNDAGPVAEPAVLFGAIATVAVAAASLFGVVLDVTVVEGAIASVVPLVTALFIRSKVTPVA